VSEAGRELWTTEAWSTVHRLPPDRRGVVRPHPFAREPNTLSAEERAQGFELLFDGRSVEGLGGKRGLPAGWSVSDGALSYDPTEGSGGDLITSAEYADFDLRFEWAIASGGRGAVRYRVDATESPARTGIEYRLLDDARHPDGDRPETSAGACAGIHAPAAGVVREAGLFNRSRIVLRGDRIEHWLNGVRVVEAVIGSDEWSRRVAASPLAHAPRFARAERGVIVFHAHGDPVRFRNLRIRRLDR